MLFLEDDADFAAAAAAAMLTAGLRVLLALDAWEALRHLDSGERIDLLLADIRMPPGMPHGFAMARMAKFRRPELKLLFVTGYRDLAEAESDYLPSVLYKPIGLDQLTEAVHRTLAG